MTDKQQPNALRLAAYIEEMANELALTHYTEDMNEAAAEIRRLHSENETLQAGYNSARLEIESLRARSVEPAGEYPALPKQVGWRDSVEHCDLYWRPAVQKHNNLEPLFTDKQMRAYADAACAIRAVQPAPTAAPSQPKAASEDSPIEWAVAMWKDRARIRKELRASHGQAPAQPCMAKQSPHPEYGKGFSDGWDRCEARQAAELDEVKTVCAQAYQVVGILLSEAGRFDSPEAEKILDNLGEQRLRHTDVLPWESKAAPQQEAQEPAAWMTQEGDRVVTEKTMNAARRGGGAMLTSLHSYSVALVRAAAPQPSPVAQGDAEDAARYRWLREHSLAAGQGSITVELDDRANGHFSRSIFLAELDAAIDAARSAGGQEP